MAKIGPTFVDDLLAAGIPTNGIAWSADGTIIFSGVPQAVQDAVLAVAAAHDPNVLALADQLAAIWDAGCAITFTSAPALSATYALDNETLTEIGSVARDVASGLGFPMGGASFTYPDRAGQPHDFTEAQFRQLYAALRDYVYAVRTAFQTAQQGGTPAWPDQPVPVA